MQKGAARQIRPAPSIYSSCSTTTSYKFDTSVSGAMSLSLRTKRSITYDGD